MAENRERTDDHADNPEHFVRGTGRQSAFDLGALRSSKSLQDRPNVVEEPATQQGRDSAHKRTGQTGTHRPWRDEEANRAADQHEQQIAGERNEDGTHHPFAQVIGSRPFGGKCRKRANEVARFAAAGLEI
jgi:hypothetical protein